jgi:hypothetical protein
VVAASPAPRSVRLAYLAVALWGATSVVRVLRHVGYMESLRTLGYGGFLSRGVLCTLLTLDALLCIMSWIATTCWMRQAFDEAGAADAGPSDSEFLVPLVRLFRVKRLAADLGVRCDPLLVRAEVVVAPPGGYREPTVVGPGTVRLSEPPVNLWVVPGICATAELFGLTIEACLPTSTGLSRLMAMICAMASALGALSAFGAVITIARLQRRLSERAHRQAIEVARCVLQRPRAFAALYAVALFPLIVTAVGEISRIHFHRAGRELPVRELVSRPDAEALLGRFLDPSSRDTAVTLLRPALVLQSVVPCRRSASVDVRGSHIGAVPMTPFDFEWPRSMGQPLSFVAQIWLSDIPASFRGDLPPSGVLSFFMRLGRPFRGDAGDSRVLLHAQDVARWATSPPERIPHLGAAYIVAESYYQLPELDSARIALAFTDISSPTLRHNLELAAASLQPYPAGYQAQMFGWSWAKATSARADDENVLLLQFPLQLADVSREEDGLGLEGVLSFRITPEDLRARRFDRAWAEVSNEI